MWVDYSAVGIDWDHYYREGRAMEGLNLVVAAVAVGVVVAVGDDVVGVGQRRKWGQGFCSPQSAEIDSHWGLVGGMGGGR